MEKIPGNLVKNLEKSWNFVSPKKWEPCNFIPSIGLDRSPIHFQNETTPLPRVS